MAKLGFRTVDEMVGRSDLLKKKEVCENEKGCSLDLGNILNNPYAGKGEKVTFEPEKVYDFGLQKTLDMKVLLAKLGPALENGRKAKY